MRKVRFSFKSGEHTVGDIMTAIHEYVIATSLDKLCKGMGSTKHVFYDLYTH